MNSPKKIFANSHSSWLDRIPFLLLFGIATSVDLFHERLSRAASRCLHGTQFDVEQTSSVLELIFQKTIAGFNAPVRLSVALVSSIMERQDDHAQSVQSFTAALKVGLPSSFLVSLLTKNNSMPTCATSTVTH
jgi:origin recognition complex subunit 3